MSSIPAAGTVAPNFTLRVTPIRSCGSPRSESDVLGTIAGSYLSPIAVNPGADGILDALANLSAQASAHGHLESTDHAK
jgi:hypothetical protein